MSILWSPVDVGGIRLDHRLAMAPMTRSRATPEGVPTALNAEYYAQRASNALIITEGTQPSEDGHGYLLTPGIHTDAQVAGWRAVTDAVHGAGGRIVIQLMHVGRISHPLNTPHHRQALAPSASAAVGRMHTAEGPKDFPVPRELSEAEIGAVVQDFRHAAARAVAAGADGVEIHGANGYLVHQFLSSNANHRTDGYGGSIENRIRFAVEVIEAVASEIGAERTGIRISPGNTFNDIVEDDADELYPRLVRALAPLGLAYIHVSQTTADDTVLKSVRAEWPGSLLLNRAGAELETRFADLEAGLADVIVVGALALANPDLVERIKSGAGFNTPDSATFYGGGARGYTDYPALAGSAD